MNLRNILIQAKLEAKRPLRSKFSVFTILLMFLTIILLSTSLSSFGKETENIPISEYGVYRIRILGNNSLLDKLEEFPRLNLVDSEDADVTSIADGGNITVIAADTKRGASALREVIASLEMLERRWIKGEISKNPGVRFILNPIWIQTLKPEDTRAEEIAEPEKEEIPETPAEIPETRTEFPEEIFNKTIVTEPPVGAIPPSELEVPILFTSILSTFTILAPLFFFGLFFGAAIFREKVGKKGIYLLSSPISSADVILGKMIPYLLSVILISSASALLQEKFSLILILVLIPLTLTLMGVALMVAILSKTPEDMNFTLLFVNLILFAYLFYPAMFAGIHPIALISPVTALSEGVELSLGSFLLSLIPISFLAFISISFGTRLFRDEVIFGQRSLLNNLYDGFDMLWLKSIKYREGISSFLSGVILIPVVYFIEIAFLFLVFPVGRAVIFLLLPVAAITEELAKILGVSALLSKGRIHNALTAGILSGLGFFLIEKFIAIAYLSFLTPAGIVFLLTKFGLPPLLIHVGCSGIACYGLGKSNGKFSSDAIPFILIAFSIHTIYNFWVMWGVL